MDDVDSMSSLIRLPMIDKIQFLRIKSYELHKRYQRLIKINEDIEDDIPMDSEWEMYENSRTCSHIIRSATIMDLFIAIAGNLWTIVADIFKKADYVVIKLRKDVQSKQRFAQIINWAVTRAIYSDIRLKGNSGVCNMRKFLTRSSWKPRKNGRELENVVLSADRLLYAATMESDGVIKTNMVLRFYIEKIPGWRFKRESLMDFSTKLKSKANSCFGWKQERLMNLSNYLKLKSQ